MCQNQLFIRFFLYPIFTEFSRMLTRFLRSGLRPQLRCLSQQTPHIEEEYFEDFEPQLTTTDLEDVVVKGFSTSDDVDFVGYVVGALTKQRA